MKKLLFIILCMFFCQYTNIFGQTADNIVIQGDKGKFVFLSSVFGARAYHISPNGKYVTGTIGAGMGYVYNTEKDTLEIYNGLGSPLYTNNNKFTAGDVYVTGSSSFTIAGYYNEQTKTWDTLSRLSTNNSDLIDYYNSSSCWGLAGNTEKVVGMMYQKVLGKNQIYVGLIWENGKLTDTLYPYMSYINATDDQLRGYGSRANGISEDGSTAIGFGTDIQTSTQRSPHIWRNGKTYHVGVADERGAGGECQGSNSDGTIVVGSNLGNGAIWRWDGTQYNLESITPLPGYTGLAFTSVSNNEVAVGYMYTGLIINRIPIIYTKNTGVMDLNVFLWEMYGIDALEYNMFTPMGISSDGRKITGWGIRSTDYYSYYIHLDEEPINTRPLRLAAKQIKNSLNVSLTWGKPYNNGKEILGYNVYKNNQKVNMSLITDTKYEHQNIETGQFTYSVSTVFSDMQESKKSVEVKLQIVEIGGCYSVKRFENGIKYNRTVALNWGLPSSEIIENAPSLRTPIAAQDLPQYEMDKKESSPFYRFLHASDPRLEDRSAIMQGNIQSEDNNNTPKTAMAAAVYQNQNFDYISSIDLLGDSKISLFKWKDYYYVGDYRASFINCFDLNGNFVNTFSIEGLPSANSFTTDGKNVYIACGTRYIYTVDLENKAILDQFRVDSNTQRICYIPELDNGKGGFEIGSWSSSLLVNKDGLSLGKGFDFENVFSTVYYKGKIYASQQTGTNLTEIREYTFSDKRPTGVVFDLMSIPSVAKACSWGASVGSMNLVMMEDSTIALAVVLQATGINNFAIFVELESMPGLLGFNLYRNGTKMNANPLKKRNYADTVFFPGKYEYYVTSVFDGCESSPSRKDTLEIYPIGICAKVKELNAEEIKGEAFLKWEIPEENSSSAELLGFNIYRDQVKLNDEFIVYMQYRDKTPLGTTPLYRVESFYKNSCIASDSIQLTITGNGKCDKIHLLNLSKIESPSNPETSNVKVEWDLPYYEAMYPLSWGNDAAYTSMGLQGGIPFTVAIGFDSLQMVDFLDFNVVGMDFFLGDLAVVDPLVMIDEEIVYTDPGGRVIENTYNRIMFNKAIPLNSLKQELVVGYSVSNYKGFPVGVDYSKIVNRYGNLIAIDPTDLASWTTTDGGGNWAISILLARERNVSTASVKEGVPIGGSVLEVVKLNPTNLTVENKVFETPYFNKNTIRLLGFNVYRDNVKLNTEPIKTTQYLDETNLDLGNYYYKVGSLWSECDEMMSDTKILRITSSENLQNNEAIQIYPNPAQNEIYIQGKFERAEIIDVSGKILNSNLTNSSTLSVNHLKSGVYLLRVTTKEKIQHIRFVVN